jgi:hypothetical protein
MDENQKWPIFFGKSQLLNFNKICVTDMWKSPFMALQHEEIWMKIGIAQYNEGLCARCPWCNYWCWQEIVPFSTASKLALGPTQPPIQCVLEVPSLGVKQYLTTHPHLVPSSRMVELYFHCPLCMSSWHGAHHAFRVITPATSCVLWLAFVKSCLCPKNAK